MHSHSGCWPYPCVKQGHSSKQCRHDPFGTLAGLESNQDFADAMPAWA